jgi:trk system potassium uptake protein TrkH
MLCLVAATMLVPAFVDLADGLADWTIFLASSIFVFFVGGLLILVSFEENPARVSIKEAFVLTTLIWIVVPAFAAVPFIAMGLGAADAYFESMSGLTTTGATVIVGLDKLSRGILLWRSLLVGMGGLGIIVMAIILLPFLRVGGMQLFQTESSDRSEKVLPRVFQTLLATAGVYCLLILTCIIVYFVLGMSLFDAICHGMTTLGTGGFSTHDDSFAFFHSPSIEWAGTFFMMCGGLPFIVFIKMFQRQPLALWHDAQVRGYIVFLVVVSLIVGTWLSAVRDLPFHDAMRAAAFHVTSIVTTTGFAGEDYQKWGSFAVGIFFLLTFVGGCSGSTAGGIKIYRFQVAALLTRSHLLHLFSPNRVVTLLYNRRRLPEDVPFSVVAFLAIYLATTGVFAVLLTAMGLDLVTALSGAAAAMSNVGPGLGGTIGPAGNYSALPAEAKWVLSAAMLIGRLELFTVLVLLRPEFWRS